jgi:hypothetical protein
MLPDNPDTRNYHVLGNPILRTAAFLNCVFLSGRYSEQGIPNRRHSKLERLENDSTNHVPKSPTANKYGLACASPGFFARYPFAGLPEEKFVNRFEHESCWSGCF